MDYLENLNPEQLKAVMHGEGPLLIVAGAGTGKTMVLTRRYIHLLNSYRVPGTAYDETGSSGSERSTRHAVPLSTANILALTFTEKAAGEMEDRILQLLPNGTYDFWISTFHGFCQRILEQYGLEIGLPTKFKLLNETDAWLLLKRHITELPLDYYRPLGNPTKFLSELIRHFSRAKDEGISPERYLEFAENSALDGDADPGSAPGAGFEASERKRLKELADAYFAYRRILREEGALDFGDLIVETLRLLRERPRVLKELRQQFRYVLVDEFQDTNWAQYDLIKLLSGEDAAKANITVVGDDDQSIYKFRGASLANILQFKDDFPTAETIMLSHNYRSRQEVLDASYDSICLNNPNRLEVKLSATGLSKKLTSVLGDGGGIEVMWYRSLEDEAEAVAQKIMEIKASDVSLTWNDFAILSRSNDGTEPFILALERNSVPFYYLAMRGLYNKPLIVDLIALLSLLDGYHESSAVWRAMTAPCYAFPAHEISTYLQYAQRKGSSLWLALQNAQALMNDNPDAVRRAMTLVSHMQNLAEAAKREKPLKVFQLLLDKTNLLASIMDLPEREKMESIDLLNLFVNRIKRYEQSIHGPSMRGFLEELRAEIESGEEGALHADPDQGPELVKVMTVHAAKGLEFKYVFIVSMVDQRFPSRARHEALPLPDGLVNERLPEGDVHLEEERRLFYVAVTRAKEKAFLTGAEDYGGARKKKPSAFLGEVGQDVSKLVARANSEMLTLTSTNRSIEVEDFKEQEIYALKRRFSFTQLAAFRSCPLQYKFAHVYKIPILGSQQKSFGQSVHLTLHDVLSLHLERGRAAQGDLFGVQTGVPAEQASGLRVSLEEALRIYEEKWIDEWYESRERHDEYKAEGKKAIRTMHAKWSEKPPDVIQLEQPFDWKLGEHSLKGAIDRIDVLATGGHGIFDYKTSQPKKTEDLQREQKEQLWIYQLAMEEKGMDVRRLAYLFVLDGSEADVEILQGEKRDAFREEIQRRMQEILLSRFDPKPSPFTCRYCDFRNVCEFKQL